MRAPASVRHPRPRPAAQAPGRGTPGRPPAPRPAPAKATAAATTTEATLLSGSLGAGHDALAAGCAAALADAGVRTRTVDMIGALGAGPGAVAERVFRRVMAVAPVYDAFHFDSLRSAGRLARTAERIAVQRSTDVVERSLGGGAAELIVSVFATGAGVASRLKAAGRCRHSVVFVPDSCAHRMWVHDNTDLFLVTSRAAAASVRRYRPRAPVEVVRPPLRPPFRSVPSRELARARLGVPAADSCVLVMGGGWGLGPIVGTSAALAAAGHRVLAVAGRNTRLHRALEAVAASQPRLHPVGFTDDVAGLMAASDAVVTTPGVTCWEARAVGRPLVLLDVVPGHGRDNLAHELELGGAAVAQSSPGAVVATVEMCLDEGQGLRAAGRHEAPGGDAAFLCALAAAGVLG